MSNQRVVVLMHEEIEGLLHGEVGSAQEKLWTALEHPEGITDEQARLAGEWLYRWRWPSDPELEQYGDRWTKSGREMLEAALFPGDGEQ